MKTICIKTVLLLLFLGNLFGQNESTNRDNVQNTQSTISVYGSGTVSAQPDTIRMTISISKTERTTRLAQQEVSRLVRRALVLLGENDIEDSNISTTSLRFRPEYEYRLNRRVLVGQRADQSITFYVDGIDTNNEKVPIIIDGLIQIDGLELNQIGYSIKNNSELYVQSREHAFQDALEKANQYAELAMLKILKVLRISEENIQQYLPMDSRTLYRQAYSERAETPDSSTIMPVGELEIRTRILVVFLLE